jgi:uncharacterized membrane protein YqaE (UPF0057 family)
MRRTSLLLLASCFLLLPNFLSAAKTVSEPVPTGEFDKELVRTAVEALKNMPKKERNAKLRAAKQEIKKFKAARRAGQDPDTSTLLLVILDILLPPLAVYLHQGETNNKFWITLLLFVLGIAGAFFFSWLLIFAAIVYGLIVILGS